MGRRPKQVSYIVTLVKNREFILVRFFKQDYGIINKKIIREYYIQPYIKDGWQLLDIEQYLTDRTEDDI